MSFAGFASTKVETVHPRAVPMPRHSALYKDPLGRSGAKRAPLLRTVRTLFGASAQADLHQLGAASGTPQIVARLNWLSPWGVVLLDSVAEDAVATCTMLLTIYEDDRVTALWQVSSDPFHEHPYLIFPRNYAEQEIDVISGGVSIGQVEVAVIDRLQTPGDQASGWLTEMLSASGIGAIHGRRCRLTMPVDSEGNSVVIADGPAGPPRLDPSYSAYRWTIRDTRDTERKIRAFTRGGTTVVMPAGVVGGFGLPGSELVSEPTPIPATFRIDEQPNGTSESYFEFLFAQPFSETMREALTASEHSPPQERVLGDWYPILPPGDEDIPILERRWVYDQVAVYWRDAGTEDPWQILLDIFHPTASVIVDGSESGSASPPLLVSLDGTEENATQVFIPAVPALEGMPPGVHGDMNAHLPFPAKDQAVELLLVHTGTPSEDYPRHVHGITSGEFLRRLYAGEYSEPDPVTGEILPTRVRYDEDALALMTDVVLLRLTEPIDDVRDWAEKHVYAPTGWFPAIDPDGRISPLNQVPPESTAGLDVITDADAQPSPNWDAGETVVNVLTFRYPRLYVPSGTEERGADGIAVRDVEIQYRSEASIDRYGEQPVEYEGIVFGATGTVQGEAVMDGEFEPGRALAENRRLYVFDRFQNGAQALRVPVRRSVIPDLRAGEWGVFELSWIPDYVTRRRGAQFVGQIVAVADLDCAWRALTIEEALPIGES